MPIEENDVVYCAYTGKACQVLKSKGNRNCSTLHKLLYDFKTNKDGEIIKELKPSLGYQIVVIDESSMITTQILEDLFSFDGIYIIFLGDPFQLPPINDKYTGILDDPDIFLSQVMRQELDNEIIKFSIDIRENNSLPYSYKGNNIQIYRANELTTGMLKWADQILCSTNATRNKINAQMRALNGRSGVPRVGDKIICLKNNWQNIDCTGEALVNGTIGTIKEIAPRSYRGIPKYIGVPDNRIDYYSITLETETGNIFHVKADPKLFFGEEPTLTSKQDFMLLSNAMMRKRKVMPLDKFTFAYAVTAHKAQGSQWDNVLVIEENFPTDAYEHQRWLYTAITRAVQKVVLIRK